MMIKYLDYIGTMTKHIDAIIIVNRKGIVEYSGMYNRTNKRFMDEGSSANIYLRFIQN